MDEQTKAAFASAADTSKQLITLATGLLALEISFAKDLIAGVGADARHLVGLSWIALLLSVVAGVWTLLALTGSLSTTNPAPTPAGTMATNVQIPAIFQVLLFLAGLLLTVWFGMRGVGW